MKLMLKHKIMLLTGIAVVQPVLVMSLLAIAERQEVGETITSELDILVRDNVAG